MQHDGQQEWPRQSASKEQQGKDETTDSSEMTQGHDVIRQETENAKHHSQCLSGFLEH